MNRIYLDYAATTPLDQRVFQAMEPYFTGRFGNPGSLHQIGQEASRAVFKARRTIASLVNAADYREIIFTGSATEANNLALRGVVRSIRKQKLGTGTTRPAPRIIVSSIEHESVLETARDLERDGADVIYLPVSSDGFVDTKKLEKSLNEHTILVSVMYANNEIGTVQPISEIAEIIRNFRELRTKNYESKIKKSRWPTMIHNSSFMLPSFHTDAVQAFQYLNCDVDALGADMMTLSAHKIYGPKGIGALYVRKVANGKSKMNSPNSVFHSPFLISSIVTGGGQEQGLRSGTENVPYIVGFGKAAELACHLREKEAHRVLALRNRLMRGIRSLYKRARVNGSLEKRLPNNLNIRLPGKTAHEFLIKMDILGIAASSGSACSSRVLEPSYVLQATGMKKQEALESVRFTLGRPTTVQEIDKTLKVLKDIV